jgi:hypothetical protein
MEASPRQLIKSLLQDVKDILNEEGKQLAKDERLIPKRGSENAVKTANSLPVGGIT